MKTEAAEIKYTTDDNCYSVYYGKIVIAKSYVGDNGYEVKVLQGMDRMATIEKINKDCPEFLVKNDWSVNMRPLLFGASKKK